jgi:hypothetical protein
MSQRNRKISNRPRKEHQMRKAAVLALAVTLAGLVVGVLPASGLDNPEVIRLIDIEEESIAIPPVSGGDQPSLGGRIFLTDGLYEWAGTKRGKRVGRLEGLCTVTNEDFAARVATVYCTVAAYLPKGRILVAGFIRFAEEGPSQFVVSVVGGTGRYANARGTVTIRDLSSGNGAVVFRLVP